MSENLFNTIVIIDLIPEGELNTARKLFEDLEIIACLFNGRLKIQYQRVRTLYDLKKIMSKVLQNVQYNGLLPLLHIEGHGLNDENGFSLPDDSNCTWSQFKEFVTPINMTMGLNLMIVMATCYGASFVKAIRTTDRAPIWGIIGPTRELSANQVKTDFPAFYRTFFETQSTTKALKALKTSGPSDLYVMTSAENFFYVVWERYKNEYCTEDKLSERARAMQLRASTEKWKKIPSIRFFKRKLKNIKREKKLFNSFRNKYFMYDLYPINKKRFPVTYKKAASMRNISMSK